MQSINTAVKDLKRSNFIGKREIDTSYFNQRPMSQAILLIIFTSLFQVLNGRRDMISSPRFLEHPGEAESSSIVASSKNAKIFSLSVLAVSVSIYKQKNQSETHIKLAQVV